MPSLMYFINRLVCVIYMCWILKFEAHNLHKQAVDYGLFACFRHNFRKVLVKEQGG